MFEAEGIKAGYGARTVVDNVSLTVAAGERIGIVGRSGCGKSTLARCLCGLVTPLSGSVRLDGEALTARTRVERRTYHRRVQMVFQDADRSLPRHLPVAVPLQDAAKLQYNSASERRHAVTELITALGLPPDAAAKRPRELSGGQRQRVAIARALIVSPAVLILDEPTSALDVLVQADIMRLLDELRTSGRTQSRTAQILISHDIGLVASACSRVYVMQHGQIVEEGPTARVLSAPSHPHTRALLASVPTLDPAHPNIRKRCI